MKLLSSLFREPFPSLERLMSLLQATRYLRHWGVYLKLAIPKSGFDLPILLYVGSATGVLGFIGRFMSHLSAMIRGKSDGFYELWHEHSDKYEIVYLELLCLPEFSHRNASNWLRVQASLLCLLAESVLMLLFGAHSVLYQGSDAVAFTFSTSSASASATHPFVNPQTAPIRSRRPLPRSMARRRATRATCRAHSAASCSRRPSLTLVICAIVRRRGSAQPLLTMRQVAQRDQRMRMSQYL